MKLVSLLLLSVSLVVEGIRPCVQADWKSIEKAVHDSPLSNACAADMNVSLEDFFGRKTPTPEQNAAFDASTNCKELYSVMQKAALDRHCAELDTFEFVSWEMVVALMDVASYPKTSTHCDKEAIRQAFAPLMLNPNLMSCLASTGLYESLIKKKPPTLAEWDLVLNTTSCSNFYNDARDTLKAVPHCTMDKTEGNDIHAVESVRFEVFVAWMKFLTIVHTKHFIPAVNTALSMWTISQSANGPSHSSHDGLLIMQSMFSGAALALVGMFVFLRSRRTGEEASGLLRRSYN